METIYYSKRPPRLSLSFCLLYICVHGARISQGKRLELFRDAQKKRGTGTLCDRGTIFRQPTKKPVRYTHHILRFLSHCILPNPIWSSLISASLSFQSCVKASRISGSHSAFDRISKNSISSFHAHGIGFIFE